MPDLRTIIIAVGLSSGLAFFAGHSKGVGDERGRRAQIDLAAAQAASEATAKAQDQIDALTIKAAENEQSRQSAVRVIREHTRDVIRDPIYLETCLPADAVRLLDAATDAANGKPARESVPAGDATGVTKAEPAS